jgi:hypothetical protein
MVNPGELAINMKLSLTHYHFGASAIYGIGEISGKKCQWTQFEIASTAFELAYMPHWALQRP